MVNGILLDENLPASLTLPTSLPVQHASILGASPSDSDIWDFAKIHDLVVITKDADFSHRVSFSTPPPRVVHVRIGNTRTRELTALLEKVWPQVESHLVDAKLVNIFRDRIEMLTERSG